MAFSVIDLVNVALPALGPDWMNPDYLIKSFGDYALWGTLAVIFIETGLLFPILPGDSLLFTAGLLCAQDDIKTPLWVLCTALFFTAFAGDQCAYWIGRKAGHRLFRNPDAKIFKPSHLALTHSYFDRYGGRTIIVARFVPFVRTFAPVAAGLGRMTYATFLKFSVVGVLLWAVGLTVLGYFLGQIPFIKNNLEKTLIAIVALSLVPVVVEYLKARRSKKLQDQGVPADVENHVPHE